MRNLLVNVNSAVNFILYCAVGQKFRRVFLQTLCQFTRCGDGSTNQTGLFADLPSTPGAGDHHLRTMRRSTARRWAGDTGVPMQAIGIHDRSITPVM